MKLHKEITEGYKGNSSSIADSFVALIFKCIHSWPVYVRCPEETKDWGGGQRQGCWERRRMLNTDKFSGHITKDTVMVLFKNENDFW